MSVESCPIHFIWFGPQPFGYTHYLAVKTAAVVYNTAPYVWMYNVPENTWSSKIKELAVQKQIKDEWLSIAALTETMGHRSDFLRYQLLHDYGGMMVHLLGIEYRITKHGNDELCRHLGGNDDNNGR